jgi:two-component system sensor histidine kinase RegB
MEILGPTRASSTRNLKRLFVLRSLVIAGVLLALPGAHWFGGLSLRPLPLLAISGLLGLINLWTWKRVRSGAYIRDHEFLLQLTVDVFAIAGLLYFTGGASNPFAWFFLIPLIIAATVLPAIATWLMAALTTLCYTLLMFFFLPLNGGDHLRHNDNFAQHVFGMWFGFVLSAALISWFVTGMARTLRERDIALAEAREQALRDEQLVALGTLATGAAHELGTPLATMAVITGELQRMALEESVTRKLGILREQLGRCKRALSVISASAGEVRAESGSLVPVQNFLGQVVDEWRRQRVNAAIVTDFRPGSAAARIINEYTLHQSLINLLNNAADVSSQSVTLKASWDRRELRIDILDNGPGLHPGVASRIEQHKTTDKEYGMGLGLFLTHATVQRLGGEIALFDRESGGTCTRITLPLTEFSGTS